MLLLQQLGESVYSVQLRLSKRNQRTQPEDPCQGTLYQRVVGTDGLLYLEGEAGSVLRPTQG